MRVFKVEGPAFTPEGLFYQGLAVVDQVALNRYQVVDGHRVLYFSGEPRPFPWETITLRPRLDPDGFNPVRVKADIMSWWSGVIGLSERAREQLEPVLASWGEFLPAMTEHHQPIHLFHCMTRVDAFDVDSSTPTDQASEPYSSVEVAEWALKPEALASEMFFRDSYFDFSPLFASEAGKDAFENSGLACGVRFEEIWNDTGVALEDSRPAWKQIKFSSVRELIDYEQRNPIDGETFDIALYSLLDRVFYDRDHDQACGRRPMQPDLAEPVIMFYSHHVVQDSLDNGGIYHALGGPYHVPWAIKAYQAYGRPRAATALAKSLDLLPELRSAMGRGDYLTADHLGEVYKRLPDTEATNNEIMNHQRAASDDFDARYQRLEHVRANRDAFRHIGQ